MDKQLFYHRETPNYCDYLEDHLEKTDDAQFVDVSDLDGVATASPLLPDHSWYSIRDNICKQLEKEKNASHDLEQDMTIFEDFERELSEPLEEECLETKSGSIES